jgi:BirA family biotin operon repressor/biotin-[acetyl-CoA-carboxylase] ligase
MMAEGILPPHESRELPTRHLGRRVLAFPQLESTNTLALALAADPARHGLVLLAREQTAGRGQYGRTWHAPAGSSVLMSVLLFPPPALRRPALIVSWAAVAVGEVVLASTGTQARIKWPNDVLVGGKKVCGILIEQRNTACPDFPLATVVGLGLNVAQPAEAFVAAGLPMAASLLSVSGKVLATEEVADRLIMQMDEDYDRLLTGDFATLEALWKWRLGLLGRRVHVEAIGQELHGRLRDVTLNGLEVEVDPGTIVRVPPEIVRHIDPDSSPGGCAGSHRP